jgi:hypothetical protein
MTHGRIALSFAVLCSATALAAPPAPQALAAYDGRPVFAEGSDRSYFVWRDGETWYVRWTTMGQAKRFMGSVEAVGGKLDDLKRIDVDEELKVIRPGRPGRVVRGPRGRAVGVAPGRPAVVSSKTEDHITKADDHHILWNTETSADIDGFNFKVKDVELLRFDLKIAGTASANAVEIGRSNQHPRDNPFSVRIR